MEIGQNWIKRLPIRMAVVRIYCFVKHSKVGATSFILPLKITSSAFNRPVSTHLLRFLSLNFYTNQLFLIWFLCFFLYFFVLTDNIRLLGRKQPLSYTTVIESIRIHHVQRIIISIISYFVRLFWALLHFSFVPKIFCNLKLMYKNQKKMNKIDARLSIGRSIR